MQTSDSEIRIRLVARKLPFSKYKLLAEWLGVYQYILPADRKLSIPSPLFANASEAFAFALWADQIQSCLTTDEQSKLCQLINESSTSVIPPSLHSTLARVNFNCISSAQSQKAKWMLVLL